MKPEAGRHPSNPVVERSWDAVLYKQPAEQLIVRRAIYIFSKMLISSFLQAAPR